MLILKITHNEVENKKFFLKRCKRIGVKRKNIVIDNNIHTLVECSEVFLCSEECKRLLNVYKGKVLVPENDGIKSICKNYLFDTKPYLKRAVLSALSKYVNECSCHNNTLCVVDDDFVFCKEYLELAKRIRNLIIISETNIDAQKFMDYCLLNLGVVVRFKKDFKGFLWDLFVDLTDIFNDGRVFIRYKNGEGIIHPDKEYFICKDEYKEILSLGISSLDLCAATAVRDDVNWKC